jgi:hypothetical protein
MNNKVPYIVYESECAKHERMIRRLWILILVLLGVTGVVSINSFFNGSLYKSVY